MAGIQTQILRLPWSFLSLMMIQWKTKSLYHVHYKSIGQNFNAQGHITRKRIVRSGLKWNLSKILYLSSLSASLKIRSKLKAISCPRYFFQRSRAGNSEDNRRMCLEFELIWAFMVVLVKFDDDTMRALLYSQHFLHYKSIGKIFIAQGQVHITLKPMIQTGQK